LDFSELSRAPLGVCLNWHPVNPVQHENSVFMQSERLIFGACIVKQIVANGEKSERSLSVSCPIREVTVGAVFFMPRFAYRNDVRRAGASFSISSQGNIPIETDLHAPRCFEVWKNRSLVLCSTVVNSSNLTRNGYDSCWKEGTIGLGT
jgi:hypothetical protein